MRLRLRFDPQTPLLLGTGSGLQQVRTSGTVIPGSAAAGALARHLLIQAGAFREDPFHPEPALDPELEQVLTELQLGPLSPVPVEAAGAADGTRWLTLEAFRAPSTARTCKRKPGFQVPAPGSPSGDGVIDLLLDTLRGRTARPSCPSRKPGHRPDRFRAQIFRTGQEPAQYGEADPPFEPRMRVGLNRQTETAEEGILFQIEPVEPRAAGGFAFVGEGRLPDELWPVLQDRLGQTGQERLRLPVALGGARARGYGQGELILAPAPAEMSVATRMERFHQALGLHSSDLFLVADLRSPWPLTDPIRSPGEEVLFSVPPPEPLRSRIHHRPELSSLETEPWGGWSMAWGLPKTRRLALAPGSVLVFHVDSYQEDRDREPLLAWMEDREAYPGGTEVGTGWLTWFDPFHLDLPRRAETQAAKEASV